MIFMMNALIGHGGDQRNGIGGEYRRAFNDSHNFIFRGPSYRRQSSPGRWEKQTAERRAQLSASARQMLVRRLRVRS